jgi:glyoxylase-like metal-dependent hydrolase (beta-lactamase superfamily II)
MNDDCYEVHAIRYATMPRQRSDNFLPRDLHDGPMPMDFFVWLLQSPTRTILVDTGFSAATGVARERNFLRCPIAALKHLGVAPEQVHDVVLTHLHYDHAGNLGLLPNARFHVQDLEMQYTTGRRMCHASLRHAYAVDDVVELVRHVYADRVMFHNGDTVLAPGVELMLIGGHTQGLQSVRVRTARGWVVLASDASHYYENVERARAFPLVFNMADMLEGHRRISAAADSPQHVVPGHDPLVMQRYPRAPGDAVGIVSLHLPPSA